MPAKALPATGDIPHKSCDASGMAEIHRMYKHGFKEAPALVTGVKSGDLEHAKVVATQLDLLSVSLHAHHEGEDQRLWGALESRAPSCAVDVDRMKSHHASLAVELKKLDAALPLWRASAKPSDAKPLIEAIEGINRALGIHLPDEEKNIVPVMETVITQPEVDWFSKHGQKSTPKGQGWNALGAIISSQPDPDAWLRKHLPPPVRLIWKWVGSKKYAQTRAALEGK